MHWAYQVYLVVCTQCTRCTRLYPGVPGVPRCTRCTRLHALGLTCRLCILTTTSVQTVVRSSSSSSKTKAFCKQIVPHIQRIRHSLHHTDWTTQLILLCVTLCYFAIMHRSKDLGSCSNHWHFWVLTLICLFRYDEASICHVKILKEFSMMRMFLHEAVSFESVFKIFWKIKQIKYTYSFNSAECDIVPHGDFDVGLVINSCGSIRRSRMRTIQLKFNLNAVMMRMMKLGPWCYIVTIEYCGLEQCYIVLHSAT